MVSYKKNNFSYQLLKKFFFVYFIFAFATTMIQVFFEFKNEKQNMLTTFQAVESFFGPKLAIGIFKRDEKSYKLLMSQLKDFPSITKVQVIGIEGKEATINFVKPHSQSVNFFSKSIVFHSFKQTIKRQKKVFPLGSVNIFSSYGAIFERIKMNILTLLINALIKTFLLWFILTYFIKKIFEIPINEFIFEVRNINFENLSLLQANFENNQELQQLKIQFNELIRKLKESKDLIINQTNEAKTKNVELTNLKNELEKLVETKEERLNENMLLLKEEVKGHKKTDEKLQLANQHKSEFLANMSHEIRTPMNAILGFSEIVNKQIHDKTLKNYMESINTSGKTLLNIINDILDLSKVEAGKFHLEYSSCLIKSILDDIESIFKSQIENKGLDFELIIEPDFPPVVIIDQIRVRQVLFNLIGNALKFTFKGGIKIEITSKCLDKKSKKYNLNFSIEDSGIGIPPNQIDQVFEAFNQRSRQKYSKFGGTGLGLTISKQLSLLMGGELRAESILHKGSTFHFSLKNVEIGSSSQSEKERQNDNIPNIIFEKATILVVDDIKINRDLIQTFLEEHNFDLIMAENGEEAIALTKRFQIDLILLDIIMPVMDGFSATKFWKSEEKFQNIPIIAVTASAMKEDHDRIINICDSYLKKPVDQNEVVQEISKYLPHKADGDLTSPSEEHLNKTLGGENDITKVVDPDILVKIFQEVLLPDWKKLRPPLIINKVLDFAKEAKKVGERHRYSKLINWSHKLKGEASLFKTQEIEKDLIDFKALINEVEGLKKAS